jgi:uncharacterized protein (DUF3084 family)
MRLHFLLFLLVLRLALTANAVTDSPARLHVFQTELERAAEAVRTARQETADAQTDIRAAEQQSELAAKKQDDAQRAYLRSLEIYEQARMNYERLKQIHQQAKIS